MSTAVDFCPVTIPMTHRLYKCIKATEPNPLGRYRVVRPVTLAQPMSTAVDK